MFLVRIGADMTGRDYDLPTSLGLAAAVICTGQPLYITDAGFQLSFGAILGIWMLSPVLCEMFGCRPDSREREGKGKVRAALSLFMKKFLESMSTSAAVNLLLLGPLLYFYYEVPPYSVFLNILVIPVMPLVMGAGLAGLILGMVLPSAGGLILQVCRIVLWMYDAVCQAAGRIPGSRIVTGQPGMIWLAVYYILLAAVCIAFYKMKEEQRKKELEEIPAKEGRHIFMRLPGAAALISAAAMTLICRWGYTMNRDVEVICSGRGAGGRHPYKRSGGRGTLY